LGILVFVARRKVRRVLDVAGLHGLGAGTSALASPSSQAQGPQGTLDVRARPPGPHPRIYLTAERLARLSAAKDAQTPAYQALFAACTKLRSGDIQSGYQAWDWVTAILDLALCAKVTKDPSFAALGVHYFQALLDDRFKIGDGAGGETAVRHDDGYPIRTYGALGALAYDWLHDAPGMTPALRKKAMDRFVQWTQWFKEKGYSNDQPISNYYVGYFGAVAFAGIAAEGDDPRAAALRQQTQQMWNQEIVPAYGAKLQGGDFPEGWQYGDMVGTFLALYADAETTSRATPPAKPLLDDLPWLRQIVTLRAFALLPDGKHTFDNGDWSQKPATAPVHTFLALAAILPPTDTTAKQAEFLARLGLSKDEEWHWLRFLGSEPSHPVEDPRKGKPSYLSPGTATVFARTSWDPGSVWFALTSEPSLSDHEHLDAGHFEVVRGNDPLLIDSGDYSAFSSLSHNVVLVDDPLQSSNWEVSSAHHDIITYKRNQGLWSHTANIARFEDGGTYVYALAEYDSAFNPAGYPSDRKDRAVTRAEREAVFSCTPVPSAGAGESARLVIYDRFTLSDPRFTTTFILHGGAAPTLSGSLARFATGASAAWVTTLLPKNAAPAIVDETHNTYSDDRPFFTNKPPDGVTSFRFEVPSPASPASTERRFLHAIVIGAAASTPIVPTGIAGDEIDGAVIDHEAYVFSSRGPATTAAAVSYRAPASATHHIVSDLAPGAAYAVNASADGDTCRISLTPGSGKTATRAGVLALDVVACAAR
jgi:hypothetical protein